MRSVVRWWRLLSDGEVCGQMVRSVVRWWGLWSDGEICAKMVSCQMVSWPDGELVRWWAGQAVRYSDSDSQCSDVDVARCRNQYSYCDIQCSDSDSVVRYSSRGKVTSINFDTIDIGRDIYIKFNAVDMNKNTYIISTAVEYRTAIFDHVVSIQK